MLECNVCDNDKNESKFIKSIQIYAPGLGIGLIVAPVSQTIYSIQYKVQVCLYTAVYKYNTR